MKKQSKKNSPHKSIFIRAVSPADIKLISDLQKLTRCKAASQAFLRAGGLYIDQIKEIEKLRNESSKTSNQLREANNLLARLGNSQTLLSTYSKKFLTGKHIQQDLF